MNHNQLEHEKVQLQQKEIDRQIWAVGFKEIIGLAILTIKSLIFVNAGAIATILAFLSKSDIQLIQDFPTLGYTLSLFLWGLGLAILCSMLAYIFQSLEIETAYKKLSLTLRIIACICATASFIFFISGCNSALSLFSS